MKKYTLIYSTTQPELYSSFAKSYSSENAGIDLFCSEDMEIEPSKMVLLKLGISAKLVSSENEDNCHYWLLPRSSISKKGLMMANSVGVIDKTYRGQLMGAVVNVSKEPVKIIRGERLFQIVAPDMGHITEAICVDMLDKTSRGEGGFGSTG
jgi:dUTP pyrophosphatase